MKKSWELVLDKFKYKEILNVVYTTDKLIFPNKENTFKAFNYFEIDETEVVILGQDCYINSLKTEEKIIPQANGLAFSVNDDFKIPPSLKNIFKELKETIPEYKFENGNLERWAKQNVLLLNCSLTVEEGKSNSHCRYWKELTNGVIKEISDKTSNVVFILWGNFAKSKINLIDTTKHHVITGVHPSPLSAKYNHKGTSKSFFGHNYFIKCNQYLQKYKKKKIIW